MISILEALPAVNACRSTVTVPKRSQQAVTVDDYRYPRIGRHEQRLPWRVTCKPIKTAAERHLRRSFRQNLVPPLLGVITSATLSLSIKFHCSCRMAHSNLPSHPETVALVLKADRCISLPTDDHFRR